jgi:hypothetical protein
VSRRPSKLAQTATKVTRNSIAANKQEIRGQSIASTVNLDELL